MSTDTWELWARPEMLEALTTRNIATVYRLLQRHGFSQSRIACHTQQAQSEISEILQGRRVESYSVLVRIAEGLGIPRGYMGLAYTSLPDSRPGAGNAGTPQSE